MSAPTPAWVRMGSRAAAAVQAVALFAGLTDNAAKDVEAQRLVRAIRVVSPACRSGSERLAYLAVSNLQTEATRAFGPLAGVYSEAATLALEQVANVVRHLTPKEPR